MADPTTTTDLKRLQWSLLMLLVFAVIGAATVMASLKFLGEAVKVKTTALAAQNDVKGKLARANDEAEELREKIVRYHEMDRQGIIGQEHRLDWIEQIRRTEKERKLFDIAFELQPQQPVDKTVTAASANGIEVYSSPMKIDMPLLHENDLLNLMADLQPKVQAYLRLHRCIIDRKPQTTSERGPTAQLKAACDLDWITIREKK